MNYDEINKEDFIELLEDLTTKGNTYRSSALHDCYMQMMVAKLNIDTNLHFYYRSGSIMAESLGIEIPSKNINSYDDLLEQVEMILAKNVESTSNEYDIDINKLKSDWGYTFSHIDYCPYYESDTQSFKVWSQYQQTDIFEAFYFALFDEWHKDRSFSVAMAEKYLEGDDWNKPRTYRGKIEELNGLEVAFMKNGKITVKTKNEDFWNHIKFWYDTLDPQFKCHKRV